MIVRNDSWHRPQKKNTTGKTQTSNFGFQAPPLGTIANNKERSWQMRQSPHGMNQTLVVGQPADRQPERAGIRSPQVLRVVQRGGTRVEVRVEVQAQGQRPQDRYTLRPAS